MALLAASDRLARLATDKPDIHRIISGASMLAEIFRDPPMAPGKQADIRHVTISRRQLPGDGRWVGHGSK